MQPVNAQKYAYRAVATECVAPGRTLARCPAQRQLVAQPGLTSVGAWCRSLLLVLVSLLALLPLSGHADAGSTTRGDALVLTIDGAIGPASSAYILNGIATAEREGYRIVVLELDTPGGLDSAMRDIIKGILASTVPVATYVSPSGSRAASAGTYILYASHIAAMNPVSNLGSATPVQIGGAAPAFPEPPGAAPEEAAEPEAPAGAAGEPDADAAADAAPDTADAPPPAPAGDAMSKKMLNDAVAYIKSLAELRERNADWAELAVREAVNLTAREALEQNVIDVVAADIDDLLAQIDGREVQLNGKPAVLATTGLGQEALEPDWRTQLLMIITDPSVAYLLMLVGIYGLLLEGYNPGALVPGVVGGIALLLALFAFQVLPVDYAGLALILLGIALMIAEGFVPSFGVLGLGGLAAFVFGSVILFDTDLDGFGVSRGLIAGAAVVGGGLLLTLVIMLMRVRSRPVVSGVEGMLGDTAEALEDFDGHGRVLLDGEYWNAVCNAGPVRKGQQLRVAAIDGLTVTVEPRG